MSPFGPFYPPRLQRTVNHAERLAALLARAEHEPEGGGRPTNLWLVGRAGEVERFVEEVLCDWRSGRCAERVAARAVEEYVAFLHEGLAIHLGESAPSCCAPPAQTQVAPEDTVDRLLMSLEAGPRAGPRP